MALREILREILVPPRKLHELTSDGEDAAKTLKSGLPEDKAQQTRVDAAVISYLLGEPVTNLEPYLDDTSPPIEAKANTVSIDVNQEVQLPTPALPQEKVSQLPKAAIQELDAAATVVTDGPVAPLEDIALHFKDRRRGPKLIVGRETVLDRTRKRVQREVALVQESPGVVAFYAVPPSLSRRIR